MWCTVLFHNFIIKRGFYYFVNKNTACAHRILNNQSYCTIQNIKLNPHFDNSNENNNDLLKLIDKYEEKILYSSVIESKKIKLGYKRNKIVQNKILAEIKKKEFQRRNIEPLPVTLKYLNKPTQTEESTEVIKHEDQVTQFPFENTDTYKEENTEPHVQEIEENTTKLDSIKEQIALRKTEYEKTKNWMTGYEYYNDVNEEEENTNTWQLNYGTPDPNSKVSNVPCGGCGALLHCKDTSIPGYIPSEIYRNHEILGEKSLKSLICQRCYFLKYYDMALQVRVTPEDYPKILMKINENKRALVILMVDILDFPCSIWPNIIDIIGNKTSVIVVGNKIDLLPRDSKGYLHRIKDILADSINMSSLAQANIQHVALISAKTGYGVEELITKLHSIWDYRGDVYLVGCTNVGKSTLFNALLQSDYCKIQAVDLVQRATTSPWPGTTLNLLKFPILKPSGWRLYCRHKRLISLSKIENQENKLRKIQSKNSNNPKHAMLIGHIERTFTPETPVTETKDIFSLQGDPNAGGKINIGINEKDPVYKMSKWCYDTPGVVHPEQILHLLTTEELMLTLPKDLIEPRIFSLKPGNTLFLAGLGRLDYIEGPESIRFVVFSAEHLPVTICNTSDADDLYKNLVGTEMLQVPLGNEERLSKWPSLEPSDEIKLRGIDWEECCADVVLSSAGWVSVACGSKINFTLKAWTPGKKGIFVRNSILPKIVAMRGRKIRFTPAYRKPRFYKG